MGRTATPEKSFIAVNISISQNGSHITKRIKFINRKGTFNYSPTCDTCAHQGKVQDGIGLIGIKSLSPTCDRDEGTWRAIGRYSYREPRSCKWFKERKEGEK